MKIVFLSENNFKGTVPRDFENARTEFAWMLALGAKHHPIQQFKKVKKYDAVFVILPKLRTYLSADASQMMEPVQDPKASLCNPSFIEFLQSKNKKVYIIQEGPNWLFNDYEIKQQYDHYMCLEKCDGIFVHNKLDKRFYEGLTYGNQKVEVIPTLMIEDTLKDIEPKAEDKTLVGGNFSRWYGGFQSFLVARLYNNKIWTQTSHSKRKGEESIEGINHFDRLTWLNWMKEVSKFKYAVHLMPTVAAGTFSLNCAYFGIPCIGNMDVDTQITCFPACSVRVDDVKSAAIVAEQLRDNKDFYNEVSKFSKEAYRKYYGEEVFTKNMMEILNEKD